MTKKELLFLLSPVMAFLWVAAYLFWHAELFSRDSTRQLRMKQPEHIAKMVQTIPNEESRPQAEKILVAAYHQQNYIYDTLADYHTDGSRLSGWFVVLGIACQVYVVFRFNAKKRKEDNCMRPFDWLRTWSNHALQRFCGLGKPGERFAEGKGLVPKQTELAGASER